MWRAAIWSTVLLFQAVCGLFLAAMWTLTKFGFRDNDAVVAGHKTLTATAAATAIALALSAPLFMNRRSLPRGIGLGLATSALIFATGAGTYVLWLH
ncbi:hypothetical protein CG716_13755 [Mycolicibacterium sphagni]|uniref:Uncharacterized protein n=2 Tax=Mycolicibacterium sphagni TaxID=1786 RepID=A0A255DHT7_9MYCO|nr:hypothetical protein CG716_13755 [Mycolicibacterium sphagni]